VHYLLFKRIEPDIRYIQNPDYFLSDCSSDTVSFFLPLALLAARTLRPLAVDILSRKPCLFFLFLVDGLNVGCAMVFLF
jgi:hypothetical protein